MLGPKYLGEPTSMTDTDQAGGAADDGGLDLDTAIISEGTRVPIKWSIVFLQCMSPVRGQGIADSRIWNLLRVASTSRTRPD